MPKDVVGGGGEPGDGKDVEPQGRSIRYTRRRFLALAGAFVAGVAGVVGLFRWLGGGSGAGGSGSASREAAGLEGFRTLNVEDVPDVPAAEWVIVVDGLVEKPLRIDHATWTTLARREETADFHCVEGWSVEALRWAGVAPRTLLDLAGVKPEGKSVTYHAYGGKYNDSLSMDQTLEARTMLADTLDGAPLAAAHGGPVRLVIPTQLGYKNVKWVTRLEVTAEPVQGYWEQNGYPMNAPVG